MDTMSRPTLIKRAVFQRMMSVVKVFVKTGARRTGLLYEKENVLNIAVNAPAKDGRANLELLKFLSRRYGCTVTIIRGRSSRKKLIKFV